MSLEDRLEALEQRLTEIEAEWSKPETAADQDRSRDLGREQSQIEPIVQTYRRLKVVREQLRGAHEAEGDPELRELARAEIEEAETEETALLEQLRVQLLPSDPNDDRNVIVEIRAGTGGEEAALFAGQLYRMYIRYAERRRWKSELITVNETGIGGMREAIFEVRGQGAYSRLKYEGGVHRVQRVPETESSGRIHTSTATVAVLPEADEVEIDIDEKDLKIDVYRSQGPGGQSVNTTDSAVRITHKPTGLVVAMQDEKSQIQNRAKALLVLRSRLLKLEQDKQAAELSSARKSQIGGGGRGEKIRTYNFKENRVTEHRIGLTVYKLDKVLAGELDDVVDALIADEQTRRLGESG